MKRCYQVKWLVLLLGFLLAGCNNSNEEVEGTQENEQAPVTETNDEEKSNEPLAVKGTPEWDLQQIEKAVENNDKDMFMSYQNKENALFYKEQQRWLEEAIFRKEQGYKLWVDLYNFSQETDITAMVSFKVTMNLANTGETQNTVSYQMIKTDDKWILNDIPFEKITLESGTITVYYAKGQEEPAQKTLKDASDLVNYYSKTFNWKSGPIAIKVYPSQPEISATVPWPGLSGWNEMGESLKITSELTSDIFRFLAHEITHKMVSDITNDNASIYIQEGIATYLEGSIYRDESGSIAYDSNLVTTKAAKAIEVSKSIKTIEELGKIDYIDPDVSMYREGFLLSNYFVETKGLKTFFEMLHYLSEFDYIDKRSEHKMDTVHERTVEAIENVYGPVETVSANEKSFYIK